jgi:hypothetical protein
MTQDRVVRLANQYAELYYGDFSITAQIRLAEQLVELVEEGELTEQELREDIRHLQQNPIWN